MTINEVVWRVEDQVKYRVIDQVEYQVRYHLPIRETVFYDPVFEELFRQVREELI